MRTAAAWPVALVLTVLGVACQRGDNPNDTVGGIELGLMLSPNVALDRVAYRIHGNGVVPITGSIDVSQPSPTVTLFVSAIPMGQSYQLEMDAASRDGTVSCTAKGSFDVLANATSAVTVALQCTSDAATTENRPPVITSFAVCPLQVDVGGTITLSGAAIDADDDPISYIWTTTGGGRFGNPSAANTSFRCTPAGTQIVRLTVSDGKVSGSHEAQVICGAPTAAPRDPQGSGGSAGTSPGGQGGTSRGSTASTGSGGSANPDTNPIWPANATRLVADDLGGRPTTTPPAGSDCREPGKGRYIFQVGSQRLSWSVCRPATEPASAWRQADGQRELTSAERTRLTNALAALRRSDATTCASDTPTLTLLVTSPSTETGYVDVTAACRKPGAALTGVEPLFTVLGALAR